MVLMRALEQAGTLVCEPVLRVSVETPAAALGAILSELARLGAAVSGQPSQHELVTVAAVLPAARVPELQRRLPGLTSGEGVLESRFEGYQVARGEKPTRRRTTANPLHRDQYIHLPRQGAIG